MKQLKSIKIQKDRTRQSLDESVSMILGIDESFTRKISRKKNDELISKTGVETFIPDGVYILHETLGVRTVGGWNPEDNEGVVGILLVEDEHKIVVALEDAPEKILWSAKCKLNNEPICARDEAASDFNGEYYCQNLNSSSCIAVYYCLNYKKGNRSWYLPSSGELWMIRRHLGEIQNALSIVGGQRFVDSWQEDTPIYWSSTELSYDNTWCVCLDLNDGDSFWEYKVNFFRVRPISKFNFQI